jgi:hypothetical protein
MCAIEIRHEDGPTEVWNQYAFRPAGDARDYLGGLPAQSPGAMSRVAMTRPSLPAGGSKPMRRLALVESNADGEIEWIASGAGYGVTLYLYGWIEGAVGVRRSLIGAPFPPNYVITFSLTDDVQVELSSINFWNTDPDGVTEYHVIEDGVFNDPWDGTIVPNAENGFDITISTIGAPDGLYVVGDWEGVLEAEDTVGGSIRTILITPIDTAPPAIKVYDGRYDEEVITEPYDTFRFRVEDQWGFDPDTLALTLNPVVPRADADVYPEIGSKQVVIAGGVIQDPYTGLIQENTLGGVDVTIRGIPVLYSPCRWRYNFDGQSIVEKGFDEDSLQ